MNPRLPDIVTFSVNDKDVFIEFLTVKGLDLTDFLTLSVRRDVN